MKNLQMSVVSLVLLLLVVSLLSGSSSCTRTAPPAPPSPIVEPPPPPPPVEKPPQVEQPGGGKPTTEVPGDVAVAIDKIDGKPAGPGELPLVPVMCEVQGTVQSLPKGAEIWVVIRPVEDATWWAQPGPATVSGNRWRNFDCHFGEPGQHFGAEYDVYAVVTTKPLPLGELTGDSWREGTLLSEPVDAKRAPQ